MLSPTFAVTLTGWLVFGLGLSGIVPQLFTAAGNLSVARRGVVLSRVVGAGYLGMLAGPAVIGWISDAVGINNALAAAVLACAAGVALASTVRPAPSAVATDQRGGDEQSPADLGEKTGALSTPPQRP